MTSPMTPPTTPPTTPPRKTPLTRSRAAIAAIVTIAVAFALVIVFVLVTAARGRDDSRHQDVGTLSAEFGQQGLRVCSRTEPQPVPHSPGVVSLQTLDIGFPGRCDDALQLQLRKYKTTADRDAGARNGEGVLRPSTVATVFTWGEYTIYLQADDASAETTLRDRVIKALDAVGAR